MKPRILVVEDTPMSRELLCDWLDSEGYEVVAAADLTAAFAAVQARRPQAVLLDIQLGNEDGIELVRWMRQQPGYEHIPVVAVTAHALAAEQKRILQSGCTASLSKPLDFGQLEEQLQQCLEAK